MEKHNPLLPFAYSSLSQNETLALNTSPRDRNTIDENASSQYHTRTPNTKKRPVLKFMPSLKRKMGESFNENDDIKRRDMNVSSEPTIIDDFDDDDDNVYGDEEYELSRKEDASSFKNMLPPSSPPLESNLMSEYDITTDTNHAYTVPESPKKIIDHNNTIEDFPSEVDFLKPEHPSHPILSQSYSPQKVVMHLSSDADFGIDHFNRFKNPSVRDCPSSSTDREFEELKNASFDKARRIIIEAFEDIRTTIILENMDLYDVPDEIKDLNKMVIFNTDTDPISYQLYLTKNKLRELPPSLFKFTKLNVLGLRQNKLTKLPPLISKMVNLIDLSLGTNRLEYLPYQILDLPNLRTFRAGPNPYLKIPEDAMAITTSTFNREKQKVFVSQVKYLAGESKQGVVVPSLKCHCLNQIARYDVSYQETKNWKKHTPKIFHSLIGQAIMKGKYNEKCCECENYVVEPFAEVVEWWNFLQNREVPFKKQFCSGGCVKRYQARLFSELNEL